MLFWTIKTRVQNDEKLAFVQKGLVIVFVIKLKIFYSFILSKIGKKKRVSRYLRYRKAVLDCKVKEFKKVGKLAFFQRG